MFNIPLHKKGDVDETGNNRFITLLSTLGKLFPRILDNRFTTWDEMYNAYVEAHAGFRKSMGNTLYVTFIDFMKAFDGVVGDKMWYKLLKLSIRGKILNTIKPMYTQCHVKARIKYQNIDEFTCYLGVRQGECLSRFLFSMYLNAIEEVFMLNGYDGVDVGLSYFCYYNYADDIEDFVFQ